MVKAANKNSCIPFGVLFKGGKQLENFCDVMIRICDKKDLLSNL